MSGAAPSRPGEDLGERAGLGFTSVVRHLSLRGWLRWIYSNRSHATLRVRTRELGSGTIWCKEGRIVDAEWGQLLGEDALLEMLGLASGAVTIDFDPIDRPRRIAKPMHELLFASRGGLSGSVLSGSAPGSSAPGGTGAGGSASNPAADIAQHFAQHDAAIAASPRGTPRDQPFRNSLFIQLGKDAQEVIANARSSGPRARRMLRAEYVGGGLLLAAFILVAFAFGGLHGPSEREPALSEAKRVQQTKALLPPPSPVEAQPGAPSAPGSRELPVIPFSVLEIEPMNAEIWLDQSFVGLGRIELAPIPDGATHQLRFLAAGYETRNLYFVGAPPTGRVRLERVAERAPRGSALEPSTPSPAIRPPISNSATSNSATSDSATSHSPMSNSRTANESGDVAAVGDEGREEGARLKSWAHRRVAAAPPPTRARTPAEGSAPAAKAARVKTAPQIQLIEARTPRVQLLD